MTRTALITGASSGIGRATAKRLAGDGWRTLLVARREDRLQALAQEIGAIPLPCDVADGAAVDALAEGLAADGIVPDLVVNAAGAGRWLRLEDTPAEEAEAMIAAPFLGALHVSRALLPGMLARGAGTLIHVQSPAAFVPWPHAVGYAASRFALRGLHEALCADLAGSGVVSAQVVFGEVASDYFAANPGTRALLPRLGRLLPRLTPQDCAAVIARLARRPRPLTCAPRLLWALIWSARIAPGLALGIVRASAPPAARRN